MATTKSEAKLRMTCHAENGCGEDIEVPISQTVRTDDESFTDNLTAMKGPERLQLLVAECPSCHKPTVSTYIGDIAVRVDGKIRAATATVEDIIGNY